MVMFGLKNLKNKIKITENSVECPVKSCNVIVPRQRESFKRQEEFKCPIHNIYISPSTFEYDNELDNLLWVDAADKDLLFTKIGSVKRESRIARDNSEDAVTWNVFRFLEKTKLLSEFLTKLTKHQVENPEVIYWSYYQSGNLEPAVWAPLKEAREEFETNPKKGSEPDIIVKSKNALFFIECKLTADNNTVLMSTNQDVRQKYTSGGSQWYSQVFSSDFDTVAIEEKKYELLRFWLIGTWIVKNLNMNFCLINLVPSDKEINIEEIFKRHIRENSRRRFLRTTWESVYQFILKSQFGSKEKDKMIEYFQNKTVGYKNKELQKAFSI